MNISLQNIKIILVLAFLGVAFVADAQPSSYEHHQIPLNQQFVITDVPNGLPSIPTLGHPDHGSLWITVVGNEEQVVYVPESNYMGMDTFYFQVFNPPLQNIFVGYAIEVSESLIITKRDFASTLVGTSAIIFPLDNDSTTTGNLSLLEVSPIYNHGSVNIDGNEFEFTPDQGFQGITHMSYIACNDFGRCEKGVISVLVHDYGLPSSQSTEVLTAKEEAIPVLLPYPGYTISQSPSNGTLVLLEDFSYLYTPNTGFSGQDNFSFELTTGNGTSQYSVTAEVMDLPLRNNFAQDDFMYTPINDYIGKDVLDNDSGNLLEWSLQITSAPLHGAAWLVGNGNIKYVPYSNFEGVDRFTYKVANALGVFETATVYVTVSNFNPEASSFDLDAYDDTPIYFEYNPPFSTDFYNLIIIEEPVVGILEVNGNSVLYSPSVGYSGMATFKLEYCLYNGSCFPFDVNVNVTPSPTGIPGCIGTEDCVWAGDTSKDGIVDGKDILYLCAIGEVGSPRIGANADWIGQFSLNWTNTVQGVSKNIKHIDADGDSLITQTDANIIDINYGKRNKITPQILPTQQNPLLFNSLNNNPQPGDTIAIEVIMGQANNPAIDYSGVTFQMLYNPLIFDTAYIVFEEHSWLGYDAPVMEYSKVPYSGKLDAAFTRGDETTKSGFGHVGTVYIVVDDLNGLKIEEEEFTTISFIQSYSLTGSGHLTKLNDADVKIQIIQSLFDPELRKNALNVYPNPTDEYVNIQTDYYNPIEEVRVINMMGQILEIRKVNDTNELTLDVSHLESGVYIIDVIAKDGSLSKKLEVFRY